MIRLLIVGVWAVVITVGAGYAGATLRMNAPDDEGPRFEGLRYSSVPTLSVPVVENGSVSGYVVVRMVYTADAAVLRSLVGPPDSFIADEVFRSLYGSAQTRFGQLRRIDLETFTSNVREKVNARMGGDIIRDLLVDGINYVDLSNPEASEAGARLSLDPPGEGARNVPSASGAPDNGGSDR